MAATLFFAGNSAKLFIFEVSAPKKPCDDSLMGMKPLLNTA